MEMYVAIALGIIAVSGAVRAIVSLARFFLELDGGDADTAPHTPYTSFTRYRKPHKSNGTPIERSKAWFKEKTGG